MRGAWIASVVVLVVLSGCAGGDARPDPPEVDESSGIQAGTRTIAADETAVAGWVHDSQNRSIPGAVVTVLDTDIAPFETGRNGTFWLASVPVGRQTIHVAAPGYAAEQAVVTVSRGTLVELDIRLRELEGVGPDARAHLHDYWRGQTSRVLLDEGIDPRQRPPNAPVNPALHTLYWTTCHPNLGDTCPFVHTHFPILLPEGTPQEPVLVFPGTVEVQITLEWDAAEVLVERFGVSYLSPSMESAEVLDAAGSGSTWSIPVGRFEADAGHSLWTSWQFFFYPDNDPQQVGAAWRPATVNGPVHVRLEVFRGDEPFLEPAHPDFWVNGSVLRVLETDWAKSMSLGSPGTGSLYTKALDDGGFVPPGTGRVVVNFTWTDQATNAVGGDHVLSWRTADMNPHTTSVGDFRTAEARSCGVRCLRFDFVPETVWLDKYYQHRSAWIFYAHPGYVEWDQPWQEPGLVYHLDVTVHKDPRYLS